jgi:hypothetical protein
MGDISESREVVTVDMLFWALDLIVDELSPNSAFAVDTKARVRPAACRTACLP